MKTMKKLMMFAALAAISAPAFSNRYDAFEPVFDQMDKQIAEKSGDRITIWAYCKNTGNPFHDNSCKSALDRLSESSTAKPGLFGRKKSPDSQLFQASKASRVIHLLALQGNSSLVSGVDVIRNDEAFSVNNIAAAGVDKTQAQVVIESGIFIPDHDRFLKSLGNGYFLENLRESQINPNSRNSRHVDGWYSLEVLKGNGRSLSGKGFSDVPAIFGRMLSVEAATNPKVSFPNYVYQEPKLVDYTSAAATL